MNKKVLIVHNHYQLPGGEDTVVKNEINMLRKHGYKVYFYHRDNNEIKKFSFVQKLCIPFFMFFSIKTYLDVSRIIKKEKIELVHVHNTLNLIGPAVYYAAFRRGVPVVQTIHNFRMICPCGILFRDGKICEECLERGMFRSILHGCYRDSKLQTLVYVICFKIHLMLGMYDKLNYIFLTEFNKDKVISLRKISQKQVWIKPNFVEDSFGAEVSGYRKDQFVFVGRLEKLKGIQFLLKSWKVYQEQNNEAVLLLLGDGPQREWCEDYVKQQNLHVMILGQVSHEKAVKEMAESRALLFTSECYEGLPVSIVEALCVGTPVVCADFGNAGRLVTDKLTGAKFQKGDVPSFLKAINLVEEGYQDMQISCRNEFLTNYAEETNFKMLEQIYESLNSMKL